MNDDKSKELELYQQKGLTEEEAKTLQNYKARGMPGIAQSKAEQLMVFYVTLGYSCQEIHKDFPVYELGLLLWARVHYKWDELRVQYKSMLAIGAADASLTVKLESVRFLMNIIAATHLKWGEQLKKYIASPDREKPPECLPNTLHQYDAVMKMLEDLINPQQTGKGKAAEPVKPSLHMTVNGNVQVSNDAPAKEVKSSVRDFMVGEQLKNKK